MKVFSVSIVQSLSRIKEKVVFILPGRKSMISQATARVVLFRALQPRLVEPPQIGQTSPNRVSNTCPGVYAYFELTSQLLGGMQAIWQVAYVLQCVKQGIAKKHTVRRIRVWGPDNRT